MKRTPTERFRGRVPIGLPDECWEWTGGRCRQGYGNVWFEERQQGAHRVAWMLHHGRQIPPGLLICHTCDNPPCCNPAHLFLGTHSDNNRDTVRKGRASVGHEHALKCGSYMIRGEGNPRAKLSAEDVTHIRDALRDGARRADLATRFGVSYPTIAKIDRGVTWAHDHVLEKP